MSRGSKRESGEEENPKSEALNPKQIQTPKFKTNLFGPLFRVSCFEFVSDFEFRISNFCFWSFRGRCGALYYDFCFQLRALPQPGSPPQAPVSGFRKWIARRLRVLHTHPHTHTRHTRYGSPPSRQARELAEGHKSATV